MRQQCKGKILKSVSQWATQVRRKKIIYNGSFSSENKQERERNFYFVTAMPMYISEVCYAFLHGLRR